jgi:hypothetical protein
VPFTPNSSSIECGRSNLTAIFSPIPTYELCGDFTVCTDIEHAAVRRVAAASDCQDVAADTVWIKNATLSSFDVWTAFFSQAIRLEDVLQILESFGNRGLENCEIIKAEDPTGHKVADMLHNLYFADCAHGEVATLGLARIVLKASIRPRAISQPSESPWKCGRWLICCGQGNGRGPIWPVQLEAKD